MDLEKLRLVFRLYDIRGIAGKDFEPEAIEEYERWYGEFPGITITPEVSREIGRAYGSHLIEQGASKVLVGYEVRPFADILKDEFIEGILDTGVNVDDADKTTTPMIYFLTDHLKYDGGVNITGSHNVYFFNGYKIMQQNSKPLYGDELATLYDRIVEKDYHLADESKRGTKSMLENPFNTYKEYFLSNFNLERKLKLVIDCGNGTPGLFAKQLFEDLGVEILDELYFEPDAKFPNHVPDPESPTNMKDLMDSVKKHGADLGIAFDADGDRVGFINEKGEFIFADQMILLLSKELAERNKGKKILFDVKCTKILETMLPEFGLKPLMHRTGHAPIKDTMRKDDEIIFGGEVSGHYYFAENYPKADDGFWAAAKVIELLSKTDKPISDLLKFIPDRVRTPEIKLPCEDKVKFDVVRKVVEEFKESYDVIEIDGARVNFSETSWGLVRASNTSPYLTLRFEAETEEEVLKIKNIFADILEEFDEVHDKLDRTKPYSLTGKLGYV